jgi:DNA-binding beta-propeller fold protein YncE
MFNGHDSELLHFNSQGQLLERFSAPGTGQHILNDLVVYRSREIYVTDTAAHQVYRFDRKQHSFTPLAFHRPLFYPNGIALSDDGSLLFVADLMGVIQVDFRNNADLRNKATREVDPGKHSTLAGIDGLYSYRGNLIGVQYGTGSYRVARWRLSPDEGTVVSTEVLEYRTPLVSDPTTGAITKGKFYFIGNTGIDNYKDGRVVDPKKLEPINIAVVPLD